MKWKWILFFFLVPLLMHGQVASAILGSNLETAVLDSFDDSPAERWVARGSKFATLEYDPGGTVVGLYPKLAEVPAWPTALFGFDPTDEENQKRRALGVWGKFDRRGYNYIEVIPASLADSSVDDTEIIYEDLSTGDRYTHAPIRIPGKVMFFDTWVWGSNYNYYLEAHFEDYRGITHVFQLGDLSYVGWRNLRVTIPVHIPQAEKHIPAEKPLRFTKYVIWTRPSEVVDGFFIYFDHMKVLTDLYIRRFDGDNLVNPELLQQVWGSSEK
jgi:hypothetical protein